MPDPIDDQLAAGLYDRVVTDRGRMASMCTDILSDTAASLSGADYRGRGIRPPRALEFFAGSGLVAEGLRGDFEVVWANDICPKKARVYSANHGAERLHVRSIEHVNGAELPDVDLAWASFPCQDLSLAGQTAGIDGARSGLVWQWLRVIDEMPAAPRILVAENVQGLMTVADGSQYQRLHLALADRGYQVGALLLDARHWVPQSRPRVFVVGARGPIPQRLRGLGPSWHHSNAFVRAAAEAPGWVWWRIPHPSERPPRLRDVIEYDAPCDPPDVTERQMAMVPERHRRALDVVGLAAGYRRTRKGKQVLELRFDDLAGCLRTPEGGSSRQLLVLRSEGEYHTRLLTVRETARLMGAPEDYALPGSYNDGYKAMGDAVAVPVVHYLSEHLLIPLVRAT